MTSTSPETGRVPDRHIIPWLLLFAFAVRLAFLLISVNATSDGPPRAIYAGEWANHPELITHGHWLPLQLYLSGILLMVWDNIWVAPRLVSLVFGAATIWPFWRLLRLFFSRDVSLAASFLFILYGLHIAQSVVSSSEAVFMFVTLWAIYHFCQWWQTQQQCNLIYSALLWFPATWTKPEAWWLAVFSGISVIWRAVLNTRQGSSPIAALFRPVLTFGVLAALGPVCWLMACAVLKGDALITFHRTSAAVGEAYQARSTIYKAAFWPVGLTLSLGPLVFALALYGLIRSLRRREHLLLFAFMVAFVLPFWTLQSTGTSGVNIRHTLFLGTLLLPFAPYALEGRLRLPKLFLAAGAAWLLVIFGLGETRRGEISQKFASISPRPKERWHVTEVTDWVRQQVRPTDRLVVDSFNDEESSLQYQVRLPPEQVRIYWSPKQSIPETFTPAPRFVVQAKKGVVGKALGLDWNAPHHDAFGLRFTRRYTNSVYAVFEVKDPSS